MSVNVSNISFCKNVHFAFVWALSVQTKYKLILVVTFSSIFQPQNLKLNARPIESFEWNAIDSDRHLYDSIEIINCIVDSLVNIFGVRRPSPSNTNFNDTRTREWMTKRNTESNMFRCLTFAFEKLVLFVTKTFYFQRTQNTQKKTERTMATERDRELYKEKKMQRRSSKRARERET